MQKYISVVTDEIRYFEDGVVVSDWIDLKEFRLMTEDEILQVETLKQTEFHTVWDGDKGLWVDPRTNEQKALHVRSQMPTITPLQFDLKLNKYGLYDTVQQLVDSDLNLRIAYTRATFFSRTDSFIDQARLLLNLTDEQVDEMWMN